MLKRIQRFQVGGASVTIAGSLHNVIVGSTLIAGSVMIEGCSVPGDQYRQIHPSGIADEELILLPRWKEVHLLGHFHVEIYRGVPLEIQREVPSTASTFAVVTADRAVLPYLDLGVEDHKLTFGFKESLHIQGSMVSPLFKVYTHDPIQQVVVGGAAELTLSGLDQDSLKVSASGSSRLSLAGQVERLNLETKGAATVEAKLRSTDVLVRLSEASSVWLEESRRVTGSMSGASRLHLPQGVRENLQLKGAAAVHRR